ncbi:hypothetical protein PHYBOEH_003612 [Phytophthora boehmeriae]|uniref:FAR1 domain-containing protein n=1 Tax=Phytophthora boehmeriae TaxID=109152 RepID=A0A8T1WV86_9STRA|nr:hypothetical protein PHYBOEH_003612 [Phytophthora boehmeriae]
MADSGLRVPDQDAARHHANAQPGPAPDHDSDDLSSTLVSVPPLDKTVFSSWDEFHLYLAEYQRRTFQVYSVRTGTPVTTRNKRIKERYARLGKETPPGELLPEAMVTYTKAVVCTHHGKPRSRSTGTRNKRSKAINCMAQITLVLRRNFTTGLWQVHVSSHTAKHNHELSSGSYRSHPRVRKVTDPNVLHTVQALHKANVKASRIFEYVRDNTDKEVRPRDVHNLLASWRKSPPPDPHPASESAAAAVTATCTFAPPVVSASPRAPPQPQSQPSVASTGSMERQDPGFTVRGAHSPSITREKPTQYGKFLASFNIGKQISELMAEMEPDHFARCYAELKAFLLIAESGQVPFVTRRELTGIPSSPNLQQPGRLLSSSVAAAAASVLRRPTTGANGETNSLISPQ